MKPSYEDKDADGRHLLEILSTYNYEDPTLKIELTLQREGVQVHVSGRDVEDCAALIEYLYLRTRHLPGYAQDPETYNFITKEAELSRQKATDRQMTKNHYARVESIKKANALRQVKK